MHVERTREDDADAERCPFCPPEAGRRIPDARERQVTAHDHPRRTGLADGATGMDVGAGVRARRTRRPGAGRPAGHRARGGLRLDGPGTKRTRSLLVARVKDDQYHRVRRTAGLLPERSLQQLGRPLAGHPGDDPAVPPQRPAAAVLRPYLGRAGQSRPRALAGPACRTGGRGRQADRRARPAPAHHLLRRHGRRYRDVPGRYRRAGLGSRRPARALPAGMGRGRRPLPPGRG